MMSSDDLVTVKRHKVFEESAFSIYVAHERIADNSPMLERLGTWIPKSVLSNGNELKKKGDTGDLVIPRWTANQNYLKYESD